MEKKIIFKKGDIVYHWKCGRIKVLRQTGDYCDVMMYNERYFTIHKDELSFTPYDLVKGGFSQKRELKYPKLMKHKSTSLVVLFYEPNKGVVVNGDELFRAGHYYVDWEMPLFEDYNEPITLQNEL